MARNWIGIGAGLLALGIGGLLWGHGSTATAPWGYGMMSRMYLGHARHGMTGGGYPGGGAGYGMMDGGGTSGSDGGGASQAAISPVQKPSFAKDVAPLFQSRCASCHAGASAAAGLDLTSYRSIMKSGVTKGGAPAETILIRRLNGKTGQRMPLGGPYLATAQIQTIANWIANGAPDN